MDLRTHIEQIHERMCNIRSLTEIHRFNPEINYAWLSLFKSNGMNLNYSMERLIELDRTLSAMEEIELAKDRARESLAAPRNAERHIPAPF